MTKRAFDLVASTAALVALSPLLACTALVVRLTMGSPVLFRQKRPGLHGQVFDLVKFRTMRRGSGSDADRLTKVGRFLRSASIDELPELWNVLRGEMSLVGPRPLLAEYLPLYSARQAIRHEVRPGLTGLAQVSGRNTASWDDRLELDAQYAELQESFWLDMIIIARTITAVIRREGIAAEGEATMAPFAGSPTIL
jgi:lipopolysaccharide/colanic/teichoic acid biosynthesis glycosyltransferase